MFSLGLASFFSVGAWLNSSAGSTLSHLLYFPTNHSHGETESHCTAHKGLASTTFITPGRQSLLINEEEEAWMKIGPRSLDSQRQQC